MTIDLNDFESGKKYKGKYADDLAELQTRLEHIQVAHIVRHRAAVVMLEGWDAAGKGGIIQRMTAEWDQRNYEVYPIAAPSREELAHDFLWRFRTRLPEPGNIAVFDRSWYGRVLVERVEGYATRPQWKRAYDQINRFEAKLIESGTTLVKLFVHVSQKEQDKRLKARLDDPWKRWKTGLDDYRNRAKRPEYLAAMHGMFEQTDTPGAPWHVIDGDNKKAARIAALSIVADALEAQVSMEPPEINPEVETVARAAFKTR
ncbi:Polyphosphate kinase [Sphingomonas sp. EC-HK361]|uniref:polyphosphate kinase 2 family protein n=1 Tax=Sphingomonas sp. EC-HK361 TaxID=2038397 RepID=UPI0012536546|nr:polyphosphate kinase [Sphingomonas sp. EC-HK361]VVT03064.1 Polyphosphate kinase [Sphingomonas sp. EC-HK361]